MKRGEWKASALHFSGGAARGAWRGSGPRAALAACVRVVSIVSIVSSPKEAKDAKAKASPTKGPPPGPEADLLDMSAPGGCLGPGFIFGLQVACLCISELPMSSNPVDERTEVECSSVTLRPLQSPLFPRPPQRPVRRPARRRRIWICWASSSVRRRLRRWQLWRHPPPHPRAQAARAPQVHCRPRQHWP